MTLHVFNPEHDIALASGLPNFTAPKAGRGMRRDLGWLPKLWAKDDDIVLESKESLKGHLDDITQVDVWGWDSTIRHELMRLGVKSEMMPSEEQIEQIRQLSNRGSSVCILKQLRSIAGTIGESCVCLSIEDIEAKLNEWKEIVVKAPWSSSGRGVRYLNIENNGIKYLKRWIEKTIQQQGTIIVERKCDKVHDFAVEFMADAEDGVKAIGLSWFDTSNTAYTGNLLASEEEKRQLISQYIPLDLLDKVTLQLEQRLTPLLKGIFEGPLGVDMMICKPTWLRPCRLSFAKNLKPSETWNYLLNPCIELNLRRTMGHVALELSKKRRGTMSVIYKDEKYQLIITD